MESLVKILVVDDDQVAANIIRDQLVYADYDVFVKYDSEEAFSHLLDEETYALLVMDVNMPGLDGVTLVKRLRQNSIHTPVMFVSGSIENGLSKAIQGMGPTVDFIEKGTTVHAELVNRCTELISKSQLFVQIGEMKQMLCSVVDKMPTVSTIKDTIQGELEGHCPQRTQEMLKRAKQEIKAATEPSFLLGKFWGNILIKGILALGVMLCSYAGYVVNLNYETAQATKLEQVEFRHDISSISKNMRVQTKNISAFISKMRSGPSSRSTSLTMPGNGMP
jgi:DNA-binding response OmpR family regulator